MEYIKKNYIITIFTMLIANMLYLPEPTIDDCNHYNLDSCKRDQKLISIINDYIEKKYGHDESVRYEDYQ
jgi:hypothetical protein